MGLTDLAIVGRTEIVREGLRRILDANDFRVAVTTSNVADLIDARNDYPDIDLIIVDTTSDDQGLESCLLIKQHFPSARMVLIAENCALGAIIRALAAGADGYLFKAIASEPLISALRLVAMGEKIVPSQTITDMISHSFASDVADTPADHVDANLSDREVEILACLVKGHANKLISRQLAIAEATVKVHIKSILRKLHVSNRTQAAIWAMNRGVLPQSGRLGRDALAQAPTIHPPTTVAPALT